MAQEYYALGEVAQKLDKSEDEIKKMVASGELQALRDGEKLYFRAEIIDAMAKKAAAEETTAFGVVEKTGGVEEAKLATGEIEFDTEGSSAKGLGLSDESLGLDAGKVLDEVFGEAEKGAPAEEPPPDIFEEEKAPVPAPTYPTGRIIQEAEPDTISNVLGLSLFIPVVVIIFGLIVAGGASIGVVPGIVIKTKYIYWYIALGLVVLLGMFWGLTPVVIKIRREHQRQKKVLPKVPTKVLPKEKKTRLALVLAITSGITNLMSRFGKKKTAEKTEKSKAV